MTRGETQRELQRTIHETEELTRTLEKQLRDLKKRSWNVTSRLV